MTVRTVTEPEPVGAPHPADPLLGGTSPTPRPVALKPIALLVFVGALFLVRLGHRELYPSHEARAAQNAQRMLDTGEWGLPVLLDGQADLQKPPAFYWLAALVGGLTGGQVDAWAVRLPAALGGLLTVGVVFGFLRREGRPVAATVAALGLATAIHFTAIARTARIDVPLTCAVAASLLAFYRGCAIADGPGRRLAWHLLSAVAAAAAVLLKGPIGLALIGPTAVAFLLLERWRSRALAQAARVWSGRFGLRSASSRSLAEAPVQSEVTTGEPATSVAGYQLTRRITSIHPATDVAGSPPEYDSSHPRTSIHPATHVAGSPPGCDSSHPRMEPGQYFRLPLSSGVLGLLIVLALALPWFVWANRATDGEFVQVFFWHHNIARFAGTSPTLASYPWWYYVPRFLVDFLPWTPVLLALVVWSVRSGLWGRDRVFRFGLVWFGVMFLVLSAARFKRSDYLLPLFPSAAILLGSAAEAWVASRASQRTVRVAQWGLGAIVAAVAVGWGVMSFVVEPAEQQREEKREFAAIVRAEAPPPQEVVLYRVESHLLALRLGRPLITLVEWHDLNDRLALPGPHVVVMPTEYLYPAQQIVTSRKLVVVTRLEDHTVGKPPRPLVLVRTAD